MNEERQKIDRLINDAKMENIAMDKEDEKELQELTRKFQ
jgi:hypothetical protein